MESGVATRPIADLEAYRQRLSASSTSRATVMQPVFAAAKRAPKRVVYAEGEDDRVLRAAQVVVDEGLARPLLVGRAEVIAERIARARPAPEAGRRLRIVELRRCRCSATRPRPTTSSRSGAACHARWRRAEMRRNGTLIAAMLVRHGKADGLLCGTFGPYRRPSELRRRGHRPARRRRRPSPR